MVVASLKETRWDALVGSRGLAVASLKETRGGYPGGLSWVGGDITRGDARIALTF